MTLLCCLMKPHFRSRKVAEKGGKQAHGLRQTENSDNSSVFTEEKAEGVHSPIRSCPHGVSLHFTPSSSSAVSPLTGPSWHSRAVTSRAGVKRDSQKDREQSGGGKVPHWKNHADIIIELLFWNYKVLFLSYTSNPPLKNIVLTPPVYLFRLNFHINKTQIRDFNAEHWLQGQNSEEKADILRKKLQLSTKACNTKSDFSPLNCTGKNRNAS